MSNTYAITAWFANKGEHVGFKNLGTERKTIVAALERGEAVTVTFEQAQGIGKPKVNRTVTLTGVAGHTVTSKPSPAFPQGKPVVLCTYAESAQELASRNAKARRDAKPTSKPASKPATVATVAPSPINDVEQGHAPTPDQVLTLLREGFSRDEILSMFGPTRTVQPAPVAPVATVQPATTDKPKRERTPAQRAATEHMRAAKDAKKATAQPAAVQPAKPAAHGVTCPVCAESAPKLWATAFKDSNGARIHACDECIDDENLGQRVRNLASIGSL